MGIETFKITKFISNLFYCNFLVIWGLKHYSPLLDKWGNLIATSSLYGDWNTYCFTSLSGKDCNFLVIWGLKLVSPMAIPHIWGIATSSLYGDWNSPDMVSGVHFLNKIATSSLYGDWNKSRIYINLVGGIATSSLYGDWNLLYCLDFLFR